MANLAERRERQAEAVKKVKAISEALGIRPAVWRPYGDDKPEVLGNMMEVADWQLAAIGAILEMDLPDLEAP